MGEIRKELEHIRRDLEGNGYPGWTLQETRADVPEIEEWDTIWRQEQKGKTYHKL